MFIGEEQIEEEKEGNHHPNVTKNSNNNHSLGLEEDELDSEAELMRSMGLPLQFGGLSAHKEFVVNPSLLCFLCIFVFPDSELRK